MSPPVECDLKWEHDEEGPLARAARQGVQMDLFAGGLKTRDTPGRALSADSKGQ
jgi:hypothetical protein